MMIGPAQLILLILTLAVIPFYIVVAWKIYEKAHKPGWACLIPIYNVYVFTQIIKRPGWWMLLYLAGIIPVAGQIAVLVISIMDTIRLAKVFGRSNEFAVGLFLLAPIFNPILAFGDSSYDETRID